MNAWSKILLAVAAAAALSVARPALGNLITQPVNNGQATDSPVVTADSANFQAFLSFPNSGHFSRMVDAIFDRPFTFTLANVDRDYFV